MKIRDNKYDLAELTRRLIAARTSEPGQPPAFKYVECENVLSILESGIDFRPEIPEIDRRDIIWGAVIAAAAEKDCGADTVINHLSESEIRYLRKPLAEYILATSLGFRPFHLLRKLQLDDSPIEFSGTLPPHFEQLPLSERSAEGVPDSPIGLVTVRIPIKARTYNAAFEHAHYRLDLLRAYWNFWLNSSTTMRSSHGKRRPVNVVLPGPLYTVHKLDGSLVKERFWFEPLKIEDDWVASLERNWKGLQKWQKQIQNRLKRIKYARSLQDLFVRYTRALDLIDYDVAFNKLWAVLEYLTNSVGDYNKLIKRVLFLYPAQDHKFHSLILEHLRDVRNGIVHYDSSRISMETYLFQLKSFVEVVVLFHLRNGSRFSSLVTATDFLDHPNDPKCLQKRLLALRNALRLRTKVSGDV
jgi:hypothetical protein